MGSSPDGLIGAEASEKSHENDCSSVTKCWCDNEIDENGKHLTLKPNSLSDSYMRMADGKIEHLEHKPGRKPDAPIQAPAEA